MAVTIRVFDPAMCCSTGVCGPSVEPDLARFAADLAWLQAQGITVERYNLSSEPAGGDASIRARTITNTLAAACDVGGEIFAVPPSKPMAR